MRFLILLAGFVAFQSTALAQVDGVRLMRSIQTCATAVAMEKVLKKKYKEQSIGYGVSKKGKSLVQIWHSKDGKTWTVTRRYHSGIICFLATGHSWESRDFKAVETKS